MSILTGTEYPIAGYRITEQIYVSSKSLVYRAIREQDQKSVILKLMRSEYPTFNEIAQFRNQYTLTKNLQLTGIVKPLSLENYHNSYVLVMEDFQGISLKEWQKKQQKSPKNPISLDEFFHIAIAIATILDGLHSERIIHKDIKPANILINPTTNEVKLIDFSLASILPREIQGLSNPNVLEGTLAYISPEQTGRMNRGIDYRSDFYSLGITFFELLTGLLPFNSNEPMELVYCHIAKEAPRVSQINSSIPVILSDIVNKLMAKNPEDRYQSSQGLKHDLEICQSQWQTHQDITPFTLGSRDISTQFIIPEKLYGRQKEIEILLNTFEKVTSGKHEILLISGFSGIGKTALVNEVHKPIVERRSYFIKGKFEQFQRDTPLSALVQAFRHLINQILSENDEQIQSWKTKILSTLNTQAYVITEVIPELEKIIGKQPPVAKLPGTADQKRFNILLQKFIHVFSNKEHPLVIFLDDLQWADAASLNFIQVLMSQQTADDLKVMTAQDNQPEHGLLLIGAYRENEISATHPLYLTIQKINEAHVNINNVNLLPLTQDDLNQLVLETLHCSKEAATPLTQVLFTKTKGNPFFINKFLKSLYDQGLIILNTSAGCWEYEISKIQELTLTDDVVEFMAEQIQKLPETTQEVLKIAACIGNEFDIQTLAIAYNKSTSKTVSDLWIALMEGLILAQGSCYNFLLSENFTNIDIDDITTSDQENNNYQPTQYKFVHDRIQQATYSLISEAERKNLHLEIGLILLRNSSMSATEENIFALVNQFNIAVDLITHSEHRHKLATMNLTAGRKALASTAYSAALKYLTTGLQLLQPDCWDTQYELALALHETTAEAKYLSGNFEQMEKLIETVLVKAKTLVDQLKVYEITIESYKAQGRSFDAINTGLKVLNLLGIPFPEQPQQQDIAIELQKLQLAFGDKKIEDFVALPELVDTDKLAIMRIFGRLLPIAYASNPLLFSLIALKQVNLSFSYGNCGISSVAYVVYAVIRWNLLGDFHSCYQLGQLGLNLLAKFNPRELMSMGIFVVNNFTIHWQEHLQQTLNPFINAYSVGLETGDLEQAAYALYMHSEHSLFLGKHLVELEKQMRSYHLKITQLNQEIPLQLHATNWQTVLNLLCSEDPCSLKDEAYDEESMLPVIKQAGNQLAILYFHVEKLFLCYLFADYTQAWANATYAEQYLDTVPAKFVVTIFYFYSSLSALAIYPDKNPEEQEEILKLVAANQQKMQQWADNAPMNFLHKYYLVEAELKRINRQHLDAIELYDRAIALAQEHEYIHESALANELAAKFYLQWGKQKFAQSYLIDAYYGYLRWGAATKLRHLQAQYPEILASFIQQDTLIPKSHFYSDINLDNSAETSTLTSNDTVISSHSTSISDMLDLAAVIKAYQTISGEIELQELLSKLIELVMENAGASKCVLILHDEKNSSLNVTAISLNSTFAATHTEFLSTPLESSEDIPITIINYVKRTQEILVIDDTSHHTSLTTDIYITNKKPKSILCIPMVNQSKLLGIVYLENNLITSAFTRDRLEVIKLLITQAGISLENAMLYKNLAEAKESLEEYNHNLEAKVAARTTELHNKNQSLQAALQQLKLTQSQLIQSEKMSSLGQMVAGIAHEINNPINFIHANLIHTTEYIENLLDLINIYKQEYPEDSPNILEKCEEIDLDFIGEDLPRILNSMKVGSLRIRDIVLSLRNFSRLDEADMKPVDIHEGIDNTLLILQHRIYKNSSENQQNSEQIEPKILIIKEYGKLPLVTCYASQINQVFLNILTNAVDAIENSKSQNAELLTKPQICIRTELTKSQIVRISISDNGCGIPETIQAKIFDPFFTTKPIGSGTGLGLSVSYQIVVEKHKGKLICNSTPGEGTEFIIDIPLQQF
ncbi:serine/threonine protein kinase [Nostoc sp. CENA543]|uniref:ATP-binding sensor histidine kinase n=1 Tax=Nostoc sp. CENA543 TaxID=1869241 RepID=UPI000CA23942|nr:ATP-binding sensor histidine kinase [Nostoc sp. CENA543]AUT01034.1 serine/threonine protein kinase [Nostoc sp. CENA543]